MNPETLDCTGLPCPKPVLRAKDALAAGSSLIKVLVDNEASQNNVARFARSQGHEARLNREGDSLFAVTIVASGEPSKGAFDPADYQCSLPERTKMIYVISSDSMGRGSDQLGWALLQTYVQTIKDVEPLPSKVVLYNGGVKLVTTESGALDALRELQGKGVEILACGTCLDFFELKSALQVGQISNMHEIMSAMAEADKIVSPL
ncbi:sulfurtransferase-like selenium metabolism protein YedF [Desulfobulbus rhabdoformis]|uniref:sulfurtransferase-like selenium metabolism protein YedF n=1 Tax=Desulfobulbus rhabdoformis TaxID=34032 RepID=UPI00196265DB|nr:sulfurtransferase-like selenium metabolism protein YedF [Desulfobulbus rhabdoformis]MBM9616110.1 sulfurtransferase-like selenium metabolism protein YedF [Desulfobulbus rhabdoformis]